MSLLIFGRIAGVRSAEQSAGIIVGAFAPKSYNVNVLRDEGH